jgi:hypothetical protein
MSPVGPVLGRSDVDQDAELLTHAWNAAFTRRSHGFVAVAKSPSHRPSAPAMQSLRGASDRNVPFPRCVETAT